MLVFNTRLKRLLSEEAAQNAIEYCLLVGVIGLGAAFSCKPIANCLTTLFYALYNSVGSSF